MLFFEGSFCLIRLWKEEWPWRRASLLLGEKWRHCARKGYASSVFDKRLEKERFCGAGRGNLKLEGLPPSWKKVDKPAHLSFSCSLDLLLNQTNMRYRIRQFALSLEKVMLDITSSIFIVCFQITLEIKVEYCSTMSWTHIFASWHFFHSLRVAWHHLNFRPAFVRWADIKCWLHQEKTRQDKTKP